MTVDAYIEKFKVRDPGLIKALHEITKSRNRGSQA